MEADGISSPERPRAGGVVLSLLAGPLCASILRAHLEAPLRLPDLRERLGGAAQTTLRGQVGNLRKVGALERHVCSGMPYTVENELTDLGRAILDAADTVEVWLARAPQGPIAGGSESAKDALRALVGGWDSTILWALAVRPLSLTELDRAIPGISYPSLERRLTALRATGQVEARGNPGGAKPCLVTEWGRQAVAPLAAAWRCEREHLVGIAEPLSAAEVEAALLLAAPLVEMPLHVGGHLRLVVSDGSDAEADGRLAGVDLRVERGEVVSCLPAGAARAAGDGQVTGSTGSWAAAILDGGADGIRTDGADAELARALVAAMRRALA